MSKKEPKRVFLVDSMSHIFRAYFAPMGSKNEPLRNSKGQITQAVFVFTNILRKLLSDEKPDYIAAVFDSAAPTFRHDAYVQYKANREDMPEELASQLPYIEKVCEAFNIPILKMDGFEADDIIGTLALQCKEQDLQAVIVSNDKDLCQLVSDPQIICMRQNSQNLKRKVPVPPVEWCDEAWVENKFGLPPNKIIDYLGLMGDAIDNIPGAKGIGAKGAVKLILEYGSAEGAIKNAEKVSHKTYRNSLLENQEDIRQSLELATVHTEVPMKLDLDSLKHEEPDRQLAYKLFRELEFSTLTREFADSAPLFDSIDTPLVKTNRRYHIVDTQDDLDKLIRRLWETENWSFIVDDSNSANKADSYAKKEPLGVAIATASGFSNYIDLKNFKDDKDAAVTQLGDILSNGFLPKCTHDYKCGLAVLQKIGIQPESVTDDTMIAAYLLDSSRSKYDLATLAQLNLYTDSVNEIPADWTENQYRTAENADFAFQLAPLLFKQIEEDELGEIYEQIEMPLIPVLFEIEMAGLKVDVASLNETSEFLKVEIEAISKKIFELAGREFNINSPKQVGEVLLELNIETRHKTPTGKISTSKDALQEIGETYEIATLIIEFRELDKIKATYSDVLPTLIDDDGRIHGNLNQTVTTTGRLSSSDPNLQNIPIRTEVGRRIRRAFIPEVGNKLISADYSQLELRILAHITKDEVMLEAFKNNEDIHTKTAKLVFHAKTDEELKEKRRLAKIVNFAIAYAVESYGLSQRVGLSRAEAKDVIEDYYNTYKGIKTFMEETPEVAKAQGFITSILGRRRYLPAINDRNHNVRSRAEREAINMPIQGTASDIVKTAMLKVDKAIRREGLQAKVIMQVHDELLLEAPDNEVEKVLALVTKEMEAAVELDVPLTVEIGAGDNWMNVK